MASKRTARCVLLTLLAAGQLMALGGCTAGRLRVKASTDMNCPEDKLQTKGLMLYVEKVTGCGRENVYAYHRGQKTWVSPIDRASFDLSCPKDKLKAQHLGSNDVGVTGCGKKAVYVLAPGAGWVMNTAGGKASSK